MNNDLKIAKIKKFINDPTMNEAVKEVLLSTFLQAKEYEDVHSKAARFISTQKLEEAWGVLESFRDDREEEEPAERQIGM